MRRWPRAGRWAAYLAVAIVFAIVCAVLSHWQFARNEQRAEANRLISENYDADPVPLADLIAGTDDFDPGDEWRPVALTGRYLPDEQLLARNRAQGGTSAYEVIVPFQLEDGRIVAIDRGWVPPAYEGGAEQVPAPPEGETTVIARLRPSEPLPTSGRGAPEGQLPTIHAASIAALTGDGTVTTAYAIMVSEDPAPGEAPQALAPPEEDPGPHLSYAIQWILFAIMGFAFLGYMIRTEIRASREDDADDDEDEDDAPSPRTPRAKRPKRRDLDAEEEDAILDGRR
ncbi:SURF1 family cytochrome oxidase biogenesis protein [Microbacterium karelineae]|uniref:SURF1 family cytochrome oxidase biogenesis protein n=1 Tax=Microbacterium karelineae TaxID=2654283 RepID=UPI0018D2BFCE|nr:SURF1 family protein [Microbacterium karelineae]